MFKSNFAPIAQSDRASGFEPEGRKFESCWAQTPLKKIYRNLRPVPSLIRRNERWDWVHTQVGAGRNKKSRWALIRLCYVAFALIASVIFSSCSFTSSSKKPWHGPETEANHHLDRALKQGKKVRLAVLGRAAAEMTRAEMEYFDVKKSHWEETRTAQENAAASAQFKRLLGASAQFELMDKKALDSIVLGRKFEDPGRPLEQEAVEIANLARATHLAYWTLTRIAYGEYRILDKFTMKLIEIPAGRTLSIEAFQEVRK